MQLLLLDLCTVEPATPQARATLMRHYWGLKEIAKRLDIKPATVTLWIHTKGLPAYRRNRFRRNPNKYYYTNDALLERWEWLQVERDTKKTG